MDDLLVKIKTCRKSIKQWDNLSPYSKSDLLYGSDIYFSDIWGKAILIFIKENGYGNYFDDLNYQDINKILDIMVALIKFPALI